ncbi:hypothetical protein ACMX2H_12385 [Arthrobacter sulfonylureivorans]|uniref:hypothetical protein n=1 Tax=Arthrobacter TaxID=1663 RepID=UPI0010ADA3A6|nr:hypothetical protein [Arthrobacter sp. CAU 1506]TJY67644.1 hypothetical protein E4J89_14155 [Arthrobacter sp. CAU 1506]
MNLLGQLGGAATAETLICSRKGCRENAQWQLLWNNPKIHTPERRKVWLACDGHREWLQDYLVQRSLWKETLPLEEPAIPESGA